MRAEKAAVGETVWPNFFNGISWRSAEPGEEEEEVELMWSDWLDSSQLEELQRGLAVAADLDDGDYFAVILTCTSNNRHEKLGWCVYEAVAEMRELTEDLVISNFRQRDDTENVIFAGTTVITGRYAQHKHSVSSGSGAD